MHSWYDKDAESIDWAGIHDAAVYIGEYLRRWGRVSVRDTKEKYGTARVYCSFGWYDLHGITHPGYAYIQYKKGGILWHMQYSRILSPIFRVLNWYIIPYHRWLYRRAYGLALKKWPHLRLEILGGADWSEELGQFGVHRVRTSSNSYSIYYDWHPDNSRSLPEDSEHDK